MQLKVEQGLYVVRNRITIEPLGSVVGDFFEVVRLELYTVQLVDSTEFLDFFLGFFLGQHDISVFISSELVEDVFVGEFLTPFLFGAKIFGDGEEWHDGGMVDTVCFDFVENLYCVVQCFRNVFEDIVHFFTSFEPFLFAVEHTVGVIQVFARGETKKSVVCFGIFLIDEM